MARSDPAYRVVIVAAQSGHAVSVAGGELVRVVDVDGHQVGDMWAVDATDPSLWLSTGHTRDRCERLSACFRVGISRVNMRSPRRLPCGVGSQTDGRAAKPIACDTTAGNAPATPRSVGLAVTECY